MNTPSRRTIQQEITTSILEARKKAFRNAGPFDTQIISPASANTLTPSTIEPEASYDKQANTLLTRPLHPLDIANLATVIPGVVNSFDSDPAGILTPGFYAEQNGRLGILEGSPNSLEQSRKPRKRAIQAYLIDTIVSGTYGGNDFLNDPATTPAELHNGIQRYKELEKALILGLSGSGKSTLRDQAEAVAVLHLNINNENTEYSTYPFDLTSLQMDRPHLIEKGLETISDEEMHAIIETPPILEAINPVRAIELALIQSGSHQNLSRFPRTGRSFFMHILAMSSLFQSSTKGVLYPFPIARLNDTSFNAEHMLNELEYQYQTGSKESYAQRMNRVITALDLATSILPEDLKTILAYSAIAGKSINVVPVPAENCLENDKNYSIQKGSITRSDDLRDLLILSAFSTTGVIRPFISDQQKYLRLTPDLTNSAINEDLMRPYMPLLRLAGDLKNPNEFNQPIARAFSDSLIGLANFLCYKNQ